MGWPNVVTVAGAGAAAIAAIAGLWFQAVATYWSQQTAEDQLAQSREEGEREVRAQASRVTAWAEDPVGEGIGEVHILNRSPDPVTWIAVVLVLAEQAGGPMTSVTLRRNDLGPCTEVVYPLKTLRWSPVYRAGEKLVTPRRSLVDALYFVDRAGHAWKRSSGSLEQVDMEEIYERPTKVVVGDEVEKTRADLCGIDGTGE
ncbi:hypothetical protein GCM10010406_54910 [Streptomyces thermolineatus]|uniref:Secreted protein n=2 Tax=Streptomyces thermolineatus TaxID=44033 RepID=A0ABN3MZH5_9ACTN